MFKTDVFVCGGGPAGLATAIAARRRGFTVTVADGAHGPDIDKACGEGLLPDAISAAAQMDLSLPIESGYPFRGVRFIGKSVSATANFRSSCGLGIRRTLLHRAMADHAERIGVKLLWATPVTSLDQIRAQWIVGADGERSRVRACAGLADSTAPRVRYGFRRHHRIAPWSDYVEVYWGNRLQIYISPVARDQVCVAAVSPDPHLRIDDALEQFPALRQRLALSEIISAERGAVTTTRKLPAVTRGNIALVGDASGSVDAVTGAGVSLAFEQAVALSDALAHGRLAEYEKSHRRIMRGRRVMANVLLAMDRWPEIGERARQALSAGPWMFDRLLSLHMR